MIVFFYFALFGVFLNRRKSPILSPFSAESPLGSSLRRPRSTLEWLREYWGYLILAAGTCGFFWFRYVDTESLDYGGKLRDLLARDVLQTALGFAFGHLIRPCIDGLQFLAWSKNLEQAPTIRSSLMSFMCVFLPPLIPLCAALLLWGNITKVETEAFKIEFATIVQSEQRQLMIDLSEPAFQLKCTLLGVHELAAEIERDREFCKRYYAGDGVSLLDASLTFHRNFVDPLFDLINVIVTNQKQDIELVRSSTRNLALAYRKLLFANDPTAIKEAHKEFFTAYFRTMTELRRFDFGSQHSAFTPNQSSNDPPQADEITASPYSYIFLAYLCWFNGDQEGAIYILEKGIALGGRNLLVNGRNLNLNMNYQVLLYYSGRDVGTIIDSLEKLVKTVEELIYIEDKLEGSSFVNQYSKLLIIIRSNLAYFLAQEGKSEAVALAMAEQAYQKSPTNPYLIDNYAYVIMASAARRNPANFEGIEKAKSLFKEAAYFNRSIPNEVKRSANDTVVKNHIRQAERLLMQRSNH